MNPSPGPPASDRFRQYLENLGRDIDPGSGFFSSDTLFWRVSLEPALLLAGMRALLLPARLVDSFGMRRNVLVRMTFYTIVWITRGLVKLLPQRLRGVPAARRRE